MNLILKNLQKLVEARLCEPIFLELLPVLFPKDNKSAEAPITVLSAFAFSYFVF
jgi:hypothetical protein